MEYLLLCLDNTFFLLAMEKEKCLKSMNVWNGMVFPKFSCSFCKPSKLCNMILILTGSVIGRLV